MMHRLFRDRLSSNIQSMILKYTDEGFLLDFLLDFEAPFPNVLFFLSLSLRVALHLRLSPSSTSPVLPRFPLESHLDHLMFLLLASLFFPSFFPSFFSFFVKMVTSLLSRTALTSATP